MKELKYSINVFELEYNFRNMSKQAKKTAKFIFNNTSKSFSINEIMINCKFHKEELIQSFCELEMLGVITFRVIESLEKKDLLSV
ncbi:hypothetical protein [Companilactobacillus sp. DQM5]|uniref:hypothetical protein n=1 Tax=Companilactobacillus sp. DQM5 TaxID=3463359 RepID=UPI0040599E37